MGLTKIEFVFSYCLFVSIKEKKKKAREMAPKNNRGKTKGDKKKKEEKGTNNENMNFKKNLVVNY